MDTVKNKRGVTQEGFDRFLSRLDLDRERAGSKYELIRSKLISYFDWRDCPFAEDHADETLNRVIRKLSEGDEIRDPSTYVFGVARMLLLEIARAKEKERSVLLFFPSAELVRGDPEGKQEQIECLRECLDRLSAENRELITEYYRGESRGKIDTRKRLAERLGLPPNALRIRTFRLRQRLEACMKKRLMRLKT